MSMPEHWTPGDEYWNEDRAKSYATAYARKHAEGLAAEVLSLKAHIVTANDQLGRTFTELAALRAALTEAHATLDQLSKLGNGDVDGNSIGNTIAQEGRAALAALLKEPSAPDPLDES